MAAMEKELTADGHLALLARNPAVKSYVVFNLDGIPMRYWGKGMSHEKAVQYSALLTDYLFLAKKVVSKNARDVFGAKNLQTATQPLQEIEIENIRMRTSKGTELIINSVGEFTILVIQGFEGSVADPETEKIEGVAGEPPAEATA